MHAPELPAARGVQSDESVLGAEVVENGITLTIWKSRRRGRRAILMNELTQKHGTRYSAGDNLSLPRLLVARTLDRYADPYPNDTRWY